MPDQVPKPSQVNLEEKLPTFHTFQILFYIDNGNSAEERTHEDRDSAGLHCEVWVSQENGRQSEMDSQVDTPPPGKQLSWEYLAHYSNLNQTADHFGGDPVLN